MKKIIMYSVLILGVSSFSVKKLETNSVSTSSSRIIKVMTFNIFNGFQRGDIKKTVDEYDLNQAYQTILEGGAEIIGLNEISNNHKEATNFDNQTKLIAEALGYYYYFFGTEVGGKFGNSVLSKYPIVEINHISFKTQTIHFGGVIEAKIRHPEGDYWFFVTHFTLDIDNQISQNLEVIEIVNRREGPKILVGDFNYEPDSDQHQQLIADTDLIDPLGTSLTPNTFSIDSPKRIDYIFGNEDVTFVTNPWTDETNIASDHFPVWADVTVDFVNNNPNNDCSN